MILFGNSNRRQILTIQWSLLSTRKHESTLGPTLLLWIFIIFNWITLKRNCSRSISRSKTNRKFYWIIKWKRENVFLLSLHFLLLNRIIMIEYIWLLQNLRENNKERKLREKVKWKKKKRKMKNKFKLFLYIFFKFILLISFYYIKIK